MVHSLDKQVLAFVMFHSANVDDLVIEAFAMKTFGSKDRRIQNFTADSVKAFQAIGNHATIGENRFCLAQSPIIDTMQCLSNFLMFRIVRKPTIWAVPQIIKRTDMMNKPENLVRVGD
ncbi:MAG: hypothetical protein A2W72_09040 [Burkholderiales bacterium RIFCSPLOWO2_12_67_14]|nr:MAG: hypothetical protein A3I64_14705 [Burkholderiales bacterium RIFCSPLOWO2_02_FULL_67_64]OGB40084.1 MAG: hypothetical protein A2W72_09040 [Burkholderiales bacterium RIFCSPLOWO2_12_67_14]OGB49769.1 MAG: hypothetical protein A3E51_18695 [Burkholderiales bacterium RIFCSPHIGHO2_12_FULL_67_38]OGB82700.1 MAG: hypothetical protein A3G82_09130 [Burkholderiales bacterium RIFCSPLOWO2_12_FULL_67_210]